MSTVGICEVFESIQGESSYAGLSCFFIRLSGCNLRCRYCDTTQAYEPGERVSIEELVGRAVSSRAAMVEITGGEPLLQVGFEALAAGLRKKVARPVLVETNGSRDISIIPEGVVAVMDIKCPGSGESGAMDLANLERLRPDDELKFVLGDRADYEWARTFVREHGLTLLSHPVFFSPVFGVLDAKDLADWILQDGLAVRLQLQLHKMLGLR